MTGYLGRANRTVDEDKLGAGTQSERMDMAMSLNGRVKSFDPKTQLATIEVMHKPVFNGEPVDFPDLLEVPVDQHRGGGFAATMPIKAGDYGVIHFMGRDQDDFMETGEAKAPQTARLNDFSDGRFTPGGGPSTKAMGNYDASNAFFGTDDHKNGVRVTGDGTLSIEGQGESLFAIIADALATLIASRDVEGAGFLPSVREELTSQLERLRKMTYR